MNLGNSPRATLINLLRILIEAQFRVYNSRLDAPRRMSWRNVLSPGDFCADLSAAVLKEKLKERSGQRLGQVDQKQLIAPLRVWCRSSQNHIGALLPAIGTKTEGYAEVRALIAPINETQIKRSRKI